MKTLEEWVEEFAQNVAAQTDSIWRGDSKTGNKHVKRYIAAFDALRAHGDAGREALAVLLTHPRMDVRVSEAAKGEGLVPFEASIVLKNWENGTWALDPAEPTPSSSARGRKRSRSQ